MVVEADKKKRVLVTGASGFIGQHLVPRLQEQGYELRITSRIPVSGDDVCVIGNISGETNWNSAVKNVDCIIHLAGRAHNLHEEDTDAEKAHRIVNHDSTIALAEQALRAGVKHFIFFSTAAIHGESGAQEAPYTEQTTPRPHNGYTHSKWAAEQALALICEDTPMALTIIRPPLVYGPRVKANMQALVKLVDRLPLLPFGAIDNKRSFIAIENLVSAITKIVTNKESYGHTFLLADNAPISTRQLADAIAAGLDKKCVHMSVPIWMLRLLGKITGKQKQIERLCGDFILDTQHIQNTLQWQPPVQGDVALAAMARWYKEQH